MAGSNGKRRSIPELSVDSRLLAERLRKLDFGEFCSYAELSGVIGRNVQKEARGNLETARRMLFRDEGMVFAAVIGEGLKRLEHIKIATSDETRTKHRRLAHRRLRVLDRGIGDLEKLPNEIKVKVLAETAREGAFLAMTDPTRIKRLEAAVAQTPAQLPVSKTLELFKS